MDDEVCANCGHPREAHNNDGACNYQGSSLSSCEPCDCREYQSRDEFDAKNPYAP